MSSHPNYPINQTAFTVSFSSKEGESPSMYFKSDSDVTQEAELYV